MKLYVANCTNQHRQFVYRVPEDKRLHQTLIPMGSQALVWKDDQPEIIRAIIDQHLHYGLTAVRDISRAKKFVGICYSVDKPVLAQTIMDQHLENAKFTLAANLEERTHMASSVGSMFSDQSRKGYTPGVRNLTMAVQEHIADPYGKPSITETMRVPVNGRPPRAHDGEWG